MACVLNDYVKDHVVVSYIVESFNAYLREMKQEEYVARVLNPPLNCEVLSAENMVAVIKLTEKCPQLIFVVERHKMEDMVQSRLYRRSLKLSNVDPNWNVAVIGYHRILVLNTNVESCTRYSIIEERDLKAIVQIMLWCSENNEKLLKNMQEDEECVVCMEFKKDGMVFCRHCSAVYCVDCCRSICSLEKKRKECAEADNKKDAKPKKNKNKSKNSRKEEKMMVKCSICNECTEVTVLGDKCMRYHVCVMSKIWLKEAALLHYLKAENGIDIQAEVTKPRFDRFAMVDLLLARVPIKILKHYVTTTSPIAWGIMLRAAAEYQAATC